MNELQNQNTELSSLLEKMEESAQVQKACAKRQSLMMTVAALACVGILLVVGILFMQIQPVVEQLSLAAENLTTVSEELAAVDFEATVAGLNDTMTSAQESLTQGAAKLEQLDIDTLNAAIRDLSEVVAPLARLFGR